jgi:hypothetical protein
VPRAPDALVPDRGAPPQLSGRLGGRIRSDSRRRVERPPELVSDAGVRLKGINYDTGFAPTSDVFTRPSFDLTQVRREMEVIARDLHCTAVRISGRDPGRIAAAAEHALAEGLEVWFSPFPCDMSPDELLPYFAEGARLAEGLRQRTPRVVFSVGCEMTLFNLGFVPGATLQERIASLMSRGMPPGQSVSTETPVQRFQRFLGEAVASVRSVFGGPVTYASGPWESVDWSPFDIVGIDHYRDAANRDSYRDQLRAYTVHGRPLVVTEFGCCTYRGAEDRGGMGWAIVDRSTTPPQLTQPVVRDEQVQADYLRDLLQIFEEERIEGAFWFTFAGFTAPHRADPRLDLDCASYGLVKVLEGATGTAYPAVPWEPKRAFHALSEYYGRSASG